MDHLDERSRHRLRASAVPAGRASRLARLGSLAGGVAGSMLAEGARHLAQGKLLAAMLGARVAVGGLFQPCAAWQAPA